MQPFIVAEISKNWGPDLPLTSNPTLISQAFELVINENAQRGYVLHSFQLHRQMLGPDQLNETIVAVFWLNDHYQHFMGRAN
jgi:hypothetical protein